jgi:predicted protein tyrosine phosphatase
LARKRSKAFFGIGTSLGHPNLLEVRFGSGLHALRKRFRQHLKGKRIICLTIPDDYELMDPALIRLLDARAGSFLR